MVAYAIIRDLVTLDVRIFAASVSLACKLSCTKSCHLSDSVIEVAAGSWFRSIRQRLEAENRVSLVVESIEDRL
jgi:hypothetical protein